MAVSVAYICQLMYIMLVLHFTNYNPISKMTSNKFVPEAFRPISEKLLSLLVKLSDFNTDNQGLNSKVKRTYFNPELNDSN